MRVEQAVLRGGSHIAGLWLNRKPVDRRALDAALNEVRGLTPVVLITGGSRGIGAAIAAVFAANGWRVALVARDCSQLDATASELERGGGAPVARIVLDLTGGDAPARLQSELARQNLYADVLVNNAAAGLSGAFAAQPVDGIAALLTLNITRTSELIRLFLPSMLQRRCGGILNVASLGAYVPGPNQALYYASKAYMLSLTEAIAAESSGLGVRVSALAPGPVATGFHAKMQAERAPYRFLLPARSAQSVARAAYRGFMTGQRVIVPGLEMRAALIALKLLPHAVSVPLMRVLLKNSP